jgi:hypothetical protein
MEKEFVPYELAWELKHLGFDEPCLAFYLDNDKKSFTKCMERADTNTWLKEHMKVYGDATTAPLFQQAFRWFREKHDLYGEVKLTSVNLPNETDFAWYAYDGSGYGWEDNVFQETYEEAELACLQKLIELVKTK